MSPQKPARRKTQAAEVVPRFGIELILQVLQEIGHREGGVAVMDRRVVLAELGKRLGVEEPLLLERGFDRAYRQIVEGV